jgi:hypothetical protein
MNTEKDDVVVKPAYVSFLTYDNYIKSLGENVPPYVDSSTLQNYSGSTQSQLRVCLKFLKLIGDKNQSNQMLYQLAAANADQRKQLTRTVLEEAYPFLFDGSIDLAKATAAQFTEKFRSQNVTGETLRKAENFFLNAAKYAGIPISKWITDSRKRKVLPKGKGRGGANSDAKKEEETPGNAKITSPKNDGAPTTDSIDMFLNDFGLLKGLIYKLPKSKQWSRDRREQWLNAVTAMLDYEIEVIVEEYDDNDEVELYE